MGFNYYISSFTSYQKQNIKIAQTTFRTTFSPFSRFIWFSVICTSMFGRFVRFVCYIALVVSWYVCLCVLSFLFGRVLRKRWKGRLYEAKRESLQYSYECSRRLIHTQTRDSAKKKTILLKTKRLGGGTGGGGGGDG